MGVNLPNLLHGYIGLAPGGTAAMQATMTSARNAGFTHARFIATGYWPVDMTTGNGWVANPTAYFAGFDAMVADARARGLRLIPSLLWNVFLFPDINHQPLSALFTPGSTTRNMAEQYIRDVVTRYAGQDVILFWELGNEINLLADLDNAPCTVCSGATPNGCGTLAPTLGTPCSRSAADNFFSCNSCRGVSTSVQDLGQFAGAMATLVHSIDPSKSFSSGHGYPRPSARHLSTSPCPSCDWGADSAAEFESALMQLHPAGVDVVSVHHYPGDDGRRWGSLDDFGVAVLAKTAEITLRNGKKLYVGEYGEPRGGDVTCGAVTPCGGDPGAALTRRLSGAMLEAGVQWSGLWAWEFYQFCAVTPTCYTVMPTDAVAPWLVGHQLAHGSCVSVADGTPCTAGECRLGQCVPRVLLSRDFESAGQVGDLTAWTNCTSCTTGTAQQIARTGGNMLEVRSNDLPCSGACQYPGTYALTPAAPAAEGQGLLHVVANATGAATIRVIAFAAGGAEIGGITLDAPRTASPRAAGIVFSLPSGTANIRVRLEVTDPHSTLNVDEMRIDWRP